MLCGYLKMNGLEKIDVDIRRLARAVRNVIVILIKILKDSDGICMQN